jgi:hypothetical protein
VFDDCPLEFCEASIKSVHSTLIGANDRKRELLIEAPYDNQYLVVQEFVVEE